MNVVPVGGELFSTKKYSHFKSLKNMSLSAPHISWLWNAYGTIQVTTWTAKKKKKKFSKEFKGVTDFQS